MTVMTCPGVPARAEVDYLRILLLDFGGKVAFGLKFGKARCATPPSCLC